MNQAASTPAQFDNPAGTDGFEFVEYTAPDPELLRTLFERLGFPVTARHRSKNVTLHAQGDINFIINAEADSFGQQFARKHGPSACAMAFRVKDASRALKRCIELGAKLVETRVGPMELQIPAIEGIGGSLIYLVDRYGPRGSIYDVDFVALEGSINPLPSPRGLGLSYIDHLTHNVHRGRMDVWSEFYARLFGFREIRYFDIEGKLTGLKSRAMTSPCGKIRIPINEEGNEKAGQIQEYLDRYQGEGIQHIAMGSGNLLATVDKLRASGVKLLDTVDTYYELIDKRIPGHGENVAELHKRKILVDGKKGALLLQIFSENQLGPIFFEFIQRKGDEGFGEGNFKALFESIELDQMRRGVLSAAQGAK